MIGAAIYLDHNATAPIRPQALEAMRAALAIGGNPSSLHRPGRQARAVIEESREAVAALLDARPGEIVFTSGGSEANAAALFGLSRANGIGRILVSALEHPSVVNAAAALGLPVECLPADSEGVVALDALASALERGATNGRALVCLMLANNETGVVQPLAEAARIAHDHGALIVTDAVQAAGRMALSFAALGVDAMSVSAHKLGGPQGIGALVLRSGLDVAPLIAGAQERGRRGGTENLAGIAGFGAAARAAMEEFDRAGEIAAWRDDFEAGLRCIAPDLRVFGAGAARLGNTSCFAVPGLDAERQVIALDLAGIAVGAGAACSSGRIEVSPVLRAMGVPEDLARCAIRVSLGWNSRPEDLARCRDAFALLHARVRARETNALVGA